MSISDALFDAEEEISYWLKVGIAPDAQKRVEALLEEMDAIRLLPGFASGPFSEAPPKRTALEIIMSFTAHEEQSAIQDAFGRAAAGEKPEEAKEPTPAEKLLKEFRQS